MTDGHARAKAYVRGQSVIQNVGMEYGEATFTDQGVSYGRLSSKMIDRF